ncbi:hypothetical protein G6N74_14725 [Mesorhizobium sp. CGMCC 1.15528]|uniref:Uncharacterized protein n=1 Tax=Mesorhizobium zhangyense TaxID=1776730 RepID=A0A7C9R7V1_9HYPH|nr:hypothetical protein [Mesorhizobium zhangyense]NGN42321.1 hypothetical protein [Mesorhizobium zhangyense]
MRGKLAGLILLMGFVPSSSWAEYRVYEHTGCTKDHVKVTEEIIWDCMGLCASTPLKPTIMQEAKNTRRVYPGVVSSYTKAQIAKGAHVSTIKAKAKVKTRNLTANKPRFGGSC